MADVYAVNFNTGDNSELTATSGSVTFVSDVYHSGGYSMRSAGTADYAYRTLASTYTELYARGYFRLASTPTTSGEDVRVLDFRDSSGVSMVWLSFQYCCGQRRLRIYCARNGNTYAYNYDYQAEVWYPLELYWNEGTGSDGEIRVWVDNNEVITQTGLSITGNNVARVYFGHINSEYNTAVWTDCIAVSTTGPIYNHDTSFEEDWEDATFDAWDGQTGSPTITGLVRHNGVYSVQNSVVSLNYEGSYINVGHMKSSYWMFEVRFNERPASGDYIEFARFSRGGTDLLKLRVKNDAGTYKWGYVYRAGGSQTEVYDGTYKTGWLADTWYCVKVYINCTHTDGTAAGDYQMWIDLTLLDDIDQLNVDTDYTGITDFYLETTTDDMSTITYVDDIQMQTTDITSCKTQGSVDVETLEGEEDCVPDLFMGTGQYQVWLNCEQIVAYDVQVENEGRGQASIVLPYSTPISRGDTIHVYAHGENLIQGKVTTLRRSRSAGSKTATVQSKTARLWSRVIIDAGWEAFSGYDVGALAKLLIDHYFDGFLTSNNIDENIGITVSDVNFGERYVGDALEELATRGGCAFFVDEDYDVHFFKEGTRGGITISGSDIIDIDVEQVGEPISRVIVKGEGVNATAGSGLPEKLVNERRITTSEEANEVASAYLNYFRDQTFGAFALSGYYNLYRGQKLTVDSPRDGFYNEEFIVFSCSWSFTPGSTVTTINVGLREPTFDFIFREVQRAIEEQRINRISGHSGGAAADGDPCALYTEILNETDSTAISSGSADQIFSVLCDTEDDAATLCLIRIEITSTSGSTHVTIYFTEGGTQLGAINVYVNSGYSTDPVFLITLPYNLSNKTLVCTGDVYSGTFTIGTVVQVWQYHRHGHSNIQSSGHVFD